jgi:hypothetical protein
MPWASFDEPRRYLFRAEGAAWARSILKIGVIARQLVPSRDRLYGDRHESTQQVMREE